MLYASAMRRCLETLDTKGIRALWAKVAPHLPMMPDDKVLPAVHMARTQAESLPLSARAYSHRWLLERGYASLLPDALKPSAERLYPEVVGAVGISVNSKHVAVKTGVQTAMEHVVLDCYANGDTEPEIVKPRMQEARSKELRGLNHDRRGWR